MRWIGAWQPHRRRSQRRRAAPEDEEQYTWPPRSTPPHGPLRGTQNEALPSFQRATSTIERLRQHEVEFAQALDKLLQPEHVPDSPSAASSSSARRRRVTEELSREDDDEFVEDSEPEDDTRDRQLDADGSVDLDDGGGSNGSDSAASRRGSGGDEFVSSPSPSRSARA